MCTAINLKTDCHYFGRNLDMDFSYGEKIIISPRNYTFTFRCEKAIEKHYAIIGTAIEIKGYPLYFDATNEKGLSVAGLRFPEAIYPKRGEKGKHSISPFELIPWILTQCADTNEVKKLMKSTCLVHINFSESMPISPLHWIVSDKRGSLVIECTDEGMKIYDNEVGVMTNSPAFPLQMINLDRYRSLTPKEPQGERSYCIGLGTVGLPGDYSSLSRFVRAAYITKNSRCNTDEVSSVNQFFRILDGVSFQRGCVQLEEDKYEMTVYSSCCNTDKGIYYYKTYNSSEINAVDMHRESLNNDKLTVYPMKTQKTFSFQN